MRVRKLLIPLLAVAGVVGVMVWQFKTIANWVLDLRYHQSAPKPDYPAPRSQAEANQQDLDTFAQLPAVDRSLPQAARAEFDKRVAALRKQAGALTKPQLVLAVAETIALADNGHTNIELGALRELLNSVPVRFAWFADGLYVVRALTPQVSLLGARVLTIDGLDPAMLDGESARYYGGTAEHAHAWSVLFLESPQALHVMHARMPDDRMVLRIVDAGGQERMVELPAIAPKDALPASVPARLLSPVPQKTEQGSDGHSLLDPNVDFPPSLRGPGRTLYTTRLRGGDTLYLHLWQIRDEDDAPLTKAIDGAAGAPGDPPWKTIILDLRFDDGGDYIRAYRAIKNLPQRLAPDGRLLILTDNTTFTAVIVTAAWAKHYGGRRATIIGEKIGDRLTFWAESGNALVLPNIKLPVYFATGYHDWASGCRELRCFWPNFYYDVPAGSLDPDIVVGWRFEDYRRGVDTVLERALAESR